MPRIDGLIFGYTVFKVATDDIPTLANRLLGLGITAKIKKNGACEIRARDAKRLRSALGDISFCESKMRGLPGFLYRNRKRYGTAAGIVIALFILIYSSGSVWDVRISGGDDAMNAQVAEMLEDMGLTLGARWSALDKNKIEARLLSASDSVAWVNINRRGTVAYVTLRCKDTGVEDPDGKNTYSNVTASCDAIIEEISVVSGYATVKPGDVVRAGDILISGIIPGELGGGFCHAEGTVIGRVSNRISVSVSEYSEEKIYRSQSEIHTEYKILGFSINILKNSRNSDSKCDIIEYKNRIELFGKYKLPIEKRVSAKIPYDTVKRRRSTEELVMTASDRLSEAVGRELSDFELISIRTGGEFTDGGYVMYSDLTAIGSIGVCTEISVLPKKEGGTDG